MTLTKSQKRFNDNLVKLSEEDDYDKCIDEWKFTGIYIEDNDYDNNCLCGKPLKHQYYYINQKTGKIICSGKSCKQKLKRLEKEKRTRKIEDLFKIFTSNGMKNIGDYDLLEYCQKNFDNITEIFLNEIRKYGTIEDLNDYKIYLQEEWSNFLDIKILLDEIEELIENIIKKEKEKLEKERLEKERLKKEKLHMQRLEKERLEKERIENELKEKIKKEREKNRKERKEREEKKLLENKLSSKNYSIYGNSGKTFSWLTNNSTLLEIKNLLNEGKITECQYKNILDNR